MDVNSVLSDTRTKGDLDPEASGGMATSHWYRMAEALMPVSSHSVWVTVYVG